MQDQHEHLERPAFAKVRADGEQVGELRGECPRWILNVLDAVSMAEDRTRTALVNDILGEYAKKKKHEAMLVQKLAGGNPAEPEAAVAGA